MDERGERDEPLAPRLKALLDAERKTTDTLDNARRAAISATLDRALAPTPTPAPDETKTISPRPAMPARAAWTGIARSVSLVVLGAGLGAWGHAQWGQGKGGGAPEPPASVASVPAVAPELPAQTSADPVDTTSPSMPAPQARENQGLARSAQSRPIARRAPSTQESILPPSALPDAGLAVVNTTPSEDAPEASALAEERALIERGRAAIARRDGVSAGDALRMHASRFPNGQLAEERDALVVQALVLAGHPDDARRKAAEFEAHFPTSLFLPRVKETIRTAP